MPSYDKSTRTKLAEVVATPVTSERPTSLFADIANTTFLAAIALWLGGLASFIVLRAVPSSVLTSMKASWRLAAEALLPAAGIAAVQAVALTAVLQVLLELNVGQVARLLPFLLLAGVAVAAVNQALVAWLGGVGRFVSVALRGAGRGRSDHLGHTRPPRRGDAVPAGDPGAGGRPRHRQRRHRRPRRRRAAAGLAGGRRGRGGPRRGETTDAARRVRVDSGRGGWGDLPPSNP